MGFFRQEYWSGLPFPSPGDLPNPGVKPRSPTLWTHTLPSEPPGKPKDALYSPNKLFPDILIPPKKKISTENFSLNLCHIVFKNVLLSLLLNINNLRAKTCINFTNQLESTGVGQGTRNALVYFFQVDFRCNQQNCIYHFLVLLYVETTQEEGKCQKLIISTEKHYQYFRIF